MTLRNKDWLSGYHAAAHTPAILAVPWWLDACETLDFVAGARTRLRDERAAREMDTTDDRRL